MKGTTGEGGIGRGGRRKELAGRGKGRTAKGATWGQPVLLLRFGSSPLWVGLLGGVEGVTGTVQVMKYGQFGFGVCSSSKRPPFPSVKWRRKKKKGEMRGGGLGGFVVGETKSRCFPEL